MLVSIVTPTLDSQRFIRHTMESIWSDPSSRPDETVEQIVVDGGSSDATLDIAAEYPCRIITGSDRGMYDAINKGLAAVRGDIFGYVNSDDTVAPGALRAVRESFQQSPGAQWLVGPMVIIDEAGAQVATLRPPRWLSAARFTAVGWNCLPQPSTYFRTSFARERLGGFDERYRLAGDYDFFLRAMEEARPMYASQPLSHFRLHDANLAKNHTAMDSESRLIVESRPLYPAVRFTLKWLTKIQINAANPAWAVGKRMGRVRY